MSRSFGWVLGFAALVALSAASSCGSTDEESKVAQDLRGSCAINSDCKEKLICAFGRCHEWCKASGDCPHGAHCVLPDDGNKRVCQFEDEAACTKSKDCKGENQICASDQLCRDECIDNGECGLAQVCAGEGVCAEATEVASDGTLMSEQPSDAGASLANSSAPVDAATSPLQTSAPTGLSASAAEGPAPPAADSGSVATGFVQLLPGDRALDGAAEVFGQVNQPTEWRGRIHVTGPTSVGSDVIVAEGTDVIVAPNASINVIGGEFVVAGTADKPVRFYGEKSGKGTWGGIAIANSAATTSRMSHVLIAEAGTQGFGLSISQAVELDDVQILDSGANGLVAYNFSETGSNVSVIGAGGTAVVLGAAAAITKFPRGGVFKDNKINVAEVALGSTYDDDVTFHDIGIPYLQTQEMKLINATMRMEPGVDYRIVADTGLRLGQIGHDQTLEFLGTAEAPVIFQGENGDASPTDFWLGLVVDARVKVNSILSNVIIRHAGLRDSDALDIQSPITVDHLTLEGNAGGLNIGSEGLASDSVAIAIRDGGGIPLRTTVTGLIRLGELGDIFSFSKNADQRVQVDGGSATVSGTVPNWGLPYFLPASIDVRGGARWVIAPGVEFQMGFNTEIALDTQQPTLQAIGTQASPILFLGAEGPGSWRGLSINATAASAIDWVEVRDAGLGTGACLTLSKALPITHSKFSDCLGYGIKKSSGDTTDYLLTNTFDNMELGEIAP